MGERIALAQLVADKEIKPGDIVTGFPAVSDLDIFVNHLMTGIQAGFEKRFGQMNTRRQEGSFADYFSANRPLYFTAANTEEIRAIFLRPETFRINTKNPDKIVNNTWIEFMARADLNLVTAQKKYAYYMPCALFIRQTARGYKQPDLPIITLVRSVIGPRNQKKFADKLRELDDIDGHSREWLWSTDGSVQLR